MSPTPRVSSLCLFLALAGAAIATLQLGHTFFPGDRGLAVTGRALCTMAAIGVLVAGSRRLLERDGLPADRLALGIDAWHSRAFVIGGGIACVHILLLLAGVCVFVPFEVGAGPLPFSAVAVAGVGYLTGNFVEELVFRGYLLIVLARWVGTVGAIWLLALPFGLFHFPGLDPLALGKMLLTTGAMHFVYAYAWIATRSLAAAVALHAVGNTLLHEVVGTGKPAALALHFSGSVPDTVLFVVFFGVSALLAWLLSRLPAARRGAAWLVATPR
ncbi:MAG TPA: CPBP family intramembrane glutamic endopeptidase [Ideonella sp.]|uniref:CPBP family intramembrane glutamic endopeptidase n=1 Tax=Ideonella sp. TaxID=1929293 RepID=UPI002E3219C4|nr:CPBP family intramembrane glutamic endopeptidase [Ideonella sp.]HEX5686134.1 CPBP family intramembrane glutamic endopeptidase [Ideonella sp.]